MTDDPKDLAMLVASLPKPLLLATDIDGTLSELTVDPTASQLVVGALEALVSLRDRGVSVAVISGRPMCDLVAQFGLPDDVELLGSHGAERGAAPGGSRLTPPEASALEEVHAALGAVAERHDGAWVESKPFAAVLHVRRCAPEVGERALLEGRAALSERADVRLQDGNLVLEAAVRHTSKRTALAELRDELQPASTVFLGDDAADEAVFESLLPGDVSVKVGPGVTLAMHRLNGPADAAELLTALATMV